MGNYKRCINTVTIVTTHIKARIPPLFTTNEAPSSVSGPVYGKIVVVYIEESNLPCDSCAGNLVVLLLSCINTGNYRNIFSAYVCLRKPVCSMQAYARMKCLVYGTYKYTHTIAICLFVRLGLFVHIRVAIHVYNVHTHMYLFILRRCAETYTGET